MDMQAMMAEMEADPAFGEMMKAVQGAAETDATLTLARVEAKLDKALAFDAALVEMIVPLLPKKVAGVVAAQLRAVLE